MQFEVSKNCSEPFHAGAFRAKCMSEIGAKTIDRARVETSPEEVAKTIEVDEETAKEIIDICDPSNLKVSMMTENGLESVWKRNIITPYSSMEWKVCAPDMSSAQH